MTHIYDIIENIKTFLRNHPIVNSVTFGDMSQISLNKTEMYPLSHFSIGQTSILERTIEVSIDLVFLDIVNYTKDLNSNDDGFRGDETNLIDIYNTQLQVANALISELRRGDLYKDKFQLVGTPVCTPFTPRYEDQIAGWGVTINIQLPNNISIC